MAGSDSPSPFASPNGSPPAAIVATGAVDRSGPNSRILTDPASYYTSTDGQSKIGNWVPVTRSLRPPSKVISRFPAGHGWTTSGGTLSDDLTNPLFTDRTIKLVTTGTGSSMYVGSGAFTAQDWSGSAFRLYAMFTDRTKITTAQVTITMGAGNVVAASINSNPIVGEWNVITVNRAQFSTSAGTPNWAGVTQVQIRFQDTSVVTTLWLGGFELIPDLSTTYPSGVFILEADDGYAGQVAQMAIGVLGQRGIPVTFNPITERITNGNNVISVGQLQTWQDKWGWQISCHAYAQADHDANPNDVSSMEASFLRQKQWMHANGLHHGADHLALCPGTGSPVPQGSMFSAIERNFQSVRVNSGFYETAIAADPLRLRSILFSGNTNTQLQTNITAAAGAGGALILAIHDVIAGGTNGTSNSLPAIAATNLATILDFAASAGMQFRTRADYLAGR